MRVASDESQETVKLGGNSAVLSNILSCSRYLSVLYESNISQPHCLPGSSSSFT
jgi:hypothetical protein